MNLKGEFSILLRGEKDRRTPMKSLNEDIKTGNFKPVYLLYGEEAYLKKQYRDRITKAIFPDGDTVNYAYYEGKGINPGELIDLAETMPFFADRRLIVIENSGFFKNASPELADYIKNSKAKHKIHLSEMAKEVIKMVTQSIDSFVNNDLYMARSVIISDDVVDNYFYDIKMKLIDLIGTDPQSGEEYVDILMIAKYLERIGDHATNIAGWVEYSILGKHVDNAGEESN